MVEIPERAFPGFGVDLQFVEEVKEGIGALVEIRERGRAGEVVGQRDTIDEAAFLVEVVAGKGHFDQRIGESHFVPG